jgi:hypothetical protein
MDFSLSQTANLDDWFLGLALAYHELLISRLHREQTRLDQTTACKSTEIAATRANPRYTKAFANKTTLAILHCMNDSTSLFLTIVIVEM